MLTSFFPWDRDMAVRRRSVKHVIEIEFGASTSAGERCTVAARGRWAQQCVQEVFEVACSGRVVMMTVVVTPCIEL